MKRAAFHSLGCKVNSYETDAMTRLFKEAGYEIVPFTEKADVYVINTCTVTNIADRKSRQMLHRARQRNPEAIVVAAGCYVQADCARAEADGAVDLIIGNDRKSQVVALVEAYAERKSLVIDIDRSKEYEELPIESTAEHTRAYVKIQDGCNQFCSYCLIPYVRGRVRSRKPSEIEAEVKRLADNGFREIVLTGIHLSAYGIDFAEEPRTKLLDVIRMVHAVEGVERIRLGSLEPRVITEGFVGALKELPKVCPHFHLSLQSGCDSVLKRMNRHYTTAQYAQACALLRGAYEAPAITTDVIVGFPKETEEEFAETERFLAELGLYEMHIFKYSRRKGTAADKMDGQLTDAVKTARSARLLALNEKCSDEYRSRWIGRRLRVLFEKQVSLDGRLWMEGHSREYIRVLTPYRQGMENEIAEVTVTKADARGFVFARNNG